MAMTPDSNHDKGEGYLGTSKNPEPGNALRDLHRENRRLVDENKRLRAALQDIADGGSIADHRIAVEALHKKPSPRPPWAGDLIDGKPS